LTVLTTTKQVKEELNGSFIFILLMGQGKLEVCRESSLDRAQDLKLKLSTIVLFKAIQRSWRTNLPLG
jgi:hypothetical protein